MQINSTLLDPGVNGFALRPSLLPGGWEGGDYLDFSTFGRGRPWWLPVEPKDSEAGEGKQGFPLESSWLFLVIPGDRPPRGPPPGQVPWGQVLGWQGESRILGLA